MNNYADQVDGLDTGYRRNVDLLRSLLPTEDRPDFLRPEAVELRKLIVRYGIEEPARDIDECEIARFEHLITADKIDARIWALRTNNAWGTRPKGRRSKKRVFRHRNARPKIGIALLTREVAEWASNQFGFLVTPRRVEATVKMIRRERAFWTRS